MDSRATTLYRELEESFQGYGQDFAMRGAEPGVQRWGAPELWVPILASIAWFIKTVLKAMIEQSVKWKLALSDRKAQAKVLENRVSSLEKMIRLLLAGAHERDRHIHALDDALNTMFSQLAQHGKGMPVIPDIQLGDLERILTSLGMTARRAHTLAPQLRDRLLCSVAHLAQEVPHDPTQRTNKPDSD